MTERSKIIDRIKALMQKTTDNGCTESEAMAAASKVNTLLAEYDLSMTDISVVDNNDKIGARKREFKTGSKSHEVQFSIWGINIFCNTHCYFNGNNIIFFGSRLDTEYAHWLVSMIKGAMEREWSANMPKLKREIGMHGRTLRASFMRGMAHRVASRLKELAEERNEQVTATKHGNALVVTRNAKLNRLWDEHSKGFRTKVTRWSISSGEAYNAGKEAGNNVGFGRPVNEDSGPRQLT